MDRDWQNKMDEVGGAFERWAKEVADRIVEAAQRGARAASNAAGATNSTRSAAPRETYREPVQGSSSDGDRWRERARTQSQSWSRWAESMRDDGVDVDSLRRNFERASERWRDTPWANLCDEFVQRVEKVLRATTSGDCRTSASSVDENPCEVTTDEKPEKGRQISKYAQQLIATIETLDQNVKPKKMIKALRVQLEMDLAKMKREKKGKKK